MGPMLVAIAATPALFEHLGPTRWGIFTIALSLIGIFGIFDFGIGRALTRAVAEAAATGREAEVAGTVLCGMLALTLLGAAGGLIVMALVGGWTRHMLHIPPALQTEVLWSLYILASSAPLVILNSALWGVIAAYQRFRAANLVNVPIMTMYYLGPLVYLHFFNSLVGVMAVLVSCRLVMTIAYWNIAIQAMPELRRAKIHLAGMPDLLRMGGWMTVSNIIWPLLTYIDRFVIASVLSAAAAGYYATPSDLVARFSIVSISIMNTAYPAMSASHKADPDNAAALFRHSVLAINGLLFMPCLMVVALSHEILALWLGAGFALHAAHVLAWLGIGTFVMSQDSAVTGMMDGIGRADVNAKFSLCEIVIYIPLLVVMLYSFGIEGAAIAWSVRCVIDFVIRLCLISRFFPPLRTRLRGMIPFLVLSVVLLALPQFASSPAWRISLAALTVPLFLKAFWHVLQASERAHLTAIPRRYLPWLLPAISQ
jgi:O-antigen/teichoic acid export membrane protein